MRKGANISKDVLLESSVCSHRVIIPLYIPHEEDYYKESYQIFEYCLFSIIKTSVTKLKISVVSNNSCNSVNDKLYALQKQGYIDELIIEKEAIGKVNSILKALRTAEERLITITDADVLFCNGWEEAVVAVFEAFPKAGAVSPVPVFRKQLHLTSNIWWRYLFSKKLSFSPVKNPEAMERFAQSLGWFSLEDRFKDVICTLEGKNNALAVLGCSHFVATYKREVFEQLPRNNSKYKLGGDSEFLYTDEPVLKMGGYRLATYDNYAYHMGNHVEPWMQNVYETIAEINSKKEIAFSFKKLKKSTWSYFFTERIFKKIFYFKACYDFLLRKKGLTKEQLKKFRY